MTHYMKFGLLGTASTLLLGGVLWFIVSSDTPQPKPDKQAPPLDLPAPPDPEHLTNGEKGPEPQAADTAVLDLRLPPGTRVKIGERDFEQPHTFRFRFGPADPRRWYRYDWTTRFPQGPIERQTLVVRAGSRLHLDLLAPHSIKPEIVLETGHTGQVLTAVFSPDGATVLTASEDKTAILWDARTGKPLRMFQGHTDQVNTAVFSPDGTNVLTGSSDGTAILWKANSGQRLRRFEGHRNAVTSVAFSPDGRRLLTSSRDARALLWDVATGDALHKLERHGGPVDSVAFSPDGRLLLTGSWDGTANLWNTASGQLVHRLAGTPGS